VFQISINPGFDPEEEIKKLIINKNKKLKFDISKIPVSEKPIIKNEVIYFFLN
jgi:hypothetical protein